MIYNYKAVSNKGEIIEGSCEGENLDEVLEKIRTNKYLPISVEKSKNNRLRTNIAFKTKVSKKDMAIFCRQFYTMVDSGISIINCLEVLKKQTENKILKEAIGQVYNEVQRGMTLSEAMKKDKDIFPDFFINMVEIGEVSGTLDIILHRMSIYYEKEDKIESKVKSAIIYPIILIIVSVFVIIFLLTMVLPTFISIFESNNVLLPVPTRILLNISNSLKNHWYLYLILFLILILTINSYKQTQDGRIFFDRLKIKLPGIKKINSKIITSKFTRTLSTLLFSGIPLIQALKVVNKIIENEVVVKELEEAIESIEKGLPLWRSIEGISVFSPIVKSMINVGEESGSLDKLLDKTADFYEDEVDMLFQRMNTIIEPVLIIIMAFIIGFIVIAMAIPMFDMVNIIQM
ncbi:type II secretion system F family protein [Anaerosalibacter bizertensis]|uniref:Type II secretion system F family protein n=1 Tax=Anaerosalibacter bizertensis TaxID=932217 RepID=A0A844FFX4_9FIRM|nr:type II secretion system F family protein [Anaerosalibacter bizertensis]MSS42852.1 type II secretion system F family protein [Anaerosalibacter bizertensis]